MTNTMSIEENVRKLSYISGTNSKDKQLVLYKFSKKKKSIFERDNYSNKRFI